MAQWAECRTHCTLNNELTWSGNVMWHVGTFLCYGELVMVCLTHLKRIVKIEEHFDRTLKCQLCTVLPNLLKM